MLRRIYTAARTRWQESEDVSAYLRQKEGFPLNVDIQKDIPYGPETDKYRKMDLYYTAGMEQVLLPTVIYIRGGTAYSGSKELCQAFNMEIASRYYAVLSVDYRPYAWADFRAQLQDVCEALCYVERHLPQLPCDRERLYLCGDSGGALLALYACAVCGAQEVADAFGVERPGLRFRAAGFLSGLFFATGENSKELPGHMRRLLLPWNDRQKPYYPWMDTKRLLERCEFPPVFLQTSTGDRFRRQTLELEILLTRRGIFHRLKEWEETAGEQPRLEYRFCIQHPKWPESLGTLEEMLKFFEGGPL